jgi:hypothetical protein
MELVDIELHRLPLVGLGLIDLVKKKFTLDEKLKFIFTIVNFVNFVFGMIYTSK